VILPDFKKHEFSLTNFLLLTEVDIYFVPFQFAMGEVIHFSSRSVLAATLGDIGGQSLCLLMHWEIMASGCRSRSVFRV
jgi:hypothetical protein